MGMSSSLLMASASLMRSSSASNGSEVLARLSVSRRVRARASSFLRLSTFARSSSFLACHCVDDGSLGGSRKDREDLAVSSKPRAVAKPSRSFARSAIRSLHVNRGSSSPLLTASGDAAPCLCCALLNAAWTMPIARILALAADFLCSFSSLLLRVGECEPMMYPMAAQRTGRPRGVGRTLPRGLKESGCRRARGVISICTRP